MSAKVVSLAEERVLRQSTHLGTVTVEVYLSPQGRPFAGGVDSGYTPEKGPQFRRSIRLALIQVMNAVRDANAKEGIPHARRLGINLRPFKEKR